MYLHKVGNLTPGRKFLVAHGGPALRANGTNHPMDLTGLSSGNYNVRLTVGGVRTEQRLMVK